jgi:hypothetical protein
MARISSIVRGTQDVRPHPTEVECFYQVIESPDGRLLHLTTFGSSHRMSAPKSSQSIQLDEASAGALMALLRETFPDIRA